MAFICLFCMRNELYSKIILAKKVYTSIYVVVTVIEIGMLVLVADIA